MVQPPQPYPHSVHCLFEHEGEIAKGMAVPWPQSSLVYGTAILTHQELTTLGNLDAHYLVLHRSATPTHHMADSLRRYSHGIVSSRLFASASAPKTFQKKAWGLRMGGLKGPPPPKKPSSMPLMWIRSLPIRITAPSEEPRDDAAQAET